jgi:hypothetical protein
MDIVCTDNLLNHPDSSISKNQSRKTKNQVENRIANVEKPKRHRIAMKNHGFSEHWSELSPLEPITTVLVFATARACVSSDSQYPSESDVNMLCEPPARCGPDRR